jgi:hypothetical protein
VTKARHLHPIYHERKCRESNRIPARHLSITDGDIPSVPGGFNLSIQVSGLFNAPARQIRRKISGGFTPVDNAQVASLN